MGLGNLTSILLLRSMSVNALLSDGVGGGRLS